MELTENQKMIRDLARTFAQDKIAPIAAEIDESGEFPEATVKEMGELGLLGLVVPEDEGGVGADMVSYALVVEELSKVCGSHGLTVAAHNSLGCWPIHAFGTPEQKRRFLAPGARGEYLLSFGLTEAGAGSDAAGIRTRAVREGDSWILDGGKVFMTNGGYADIITVMAVTDPTLGARGGIAAFIVETDWEGFSVAREEDKMGIRGTSTAELVFEELRVPHENVLGKVGEGFIPFMKALDVGRVTLGAACAGGAQKTLDSCVRWAKTREQFGKPIAHKQSIQWMIADTAAGLEALRSLVYRTVWMIDKGLEFSRLAAMCKLYGSEMMSRTIDLAVQIHGGLGVTRDFDVERGFRDARINEIFEGTSEIQRIVIASDIFREHGVRISP